MTLTARIEGHNVIVVEKGDGVFNAWKLDASHGPRGLIVIDEASEVTPDMWEKLDRLSQKAKWWRMN